MKLREALLNDINGLCNIEDQIEQSKSKISPLKQTTENKSRKFSLQQHILPQSQVNVIVIIIYHLSQNEL